MINDSSFDKYKLESFSVTQSRNLINARLLAILNYFYTVKQDISFMQFTAFEQMIEKSNTFLLSVIELFYLDLCTQEEFISNLFFCYERGQESVYVKQATQESGGEISLKKILMKKKREKDECISFLESLKNDLSSFIFNKLYSVI